MSRGHWTLPPLTKNLTSALIPDARYMDMKPGAAINLHLIFSRIEKNKNKRTGNTRVTNPHIHERCLNHCKKPILHRYDTTYIQSLPSSLSRVSFAFHLLRVSASLVHAVVSLSVLLYGGLVHLSWISASHSCSLSLTLSP